MEERAGEGASVSNVLQRRKKVVEEEEEEVCGEPQKQVELATARLQQRVSEGETESATPRRRRPARPAAGVECPTMAAIAICGSRQNAQ